MVDTGWIDADADDAHAAGIGLPVGDGRVERALVIAPDLAGERLDQVLAGLLTDFSRSRIQGWIEAGQVRVDGMRVKPRTRVVGGEQVDILAQLPEVTAFTPEPMPLCVVYEDEELLVIDKPAGLVVHPAAGNWSGTLLNGLLHYDARLSALPRCGIVHRLDKDTSGLLVVARTAAAHKSLVAQLSARSVSREYRALVFGTVVAGGRVDAPIGRHPVRRTAMAVVSNGKPAVTDYRVIGRHPAATLLAVRLQTGRTHQIRVHMAHIGHALVGDPVYGSSRLRAMAGAPALANFPRQALHAVRLGLVHPRTDEALDFEVPLAADLAALLSTLGVSA
jgi:23S rRNA pseudouridine1911/1915/1917 synthase